MNWSWDKKIAADRMERLNRRLDEIAAEQPKTWEQLITPADALFAHDLRIRLDDPMEGK